MDLQETITVFCILLLFFTSIKHYTKNFFIPAEGLIMIAGLIYGVVYRFTEIPWMPAATLPPPEITLIIILPLLIFPSGQQVNLNYLRAESLPIGFFAVIGVIASAFAIGGPMAFILDIDLIDGLLLGAALGATDPAAVGAVFHRFKMPRRLQMLVEGESLFNDGTSVVLFSLVLGLAAENSVFRPFETLLHFAWALCAAIPLGILLGWVCARLLKYWHEQHVFFTTSFSLILAYGSFLLAEALLQVSGVISVLVAAISFTRCIRGESAAEVRLDSTEVMERFWDYISQMINLFLFFLLGAATGSHQFVLSTGIIAGALLVLILSRMLIVYTGGLLLSAVRVRLPLAWQHVLFLGGLRGGISAALIMLIPRQYPYHLTFLCIAFVMIAFTVIIQPVLMQLYLRRAKMPKT